MKRLVLGSTCLMLLALTACGSNEPAKDNTKVSTSAESGNCGPDVADTSQGNKHVDPGSEVDYDRVPPVSGTHWSQWPEISKLVYVAEERPELGELVHSQEHGWNVVWYDETVASDGTKMSELNTIADQLEGDGISKVVFMPWTSADGDAFPDGKHVALTHWGTESDGTEWRQFCDGANAEAIKGFAERHPNTSSPEPNAP